MFPKLTAYDKNFIARQLMRIRNADNIDEFKNARGWAAHPDHIQLQCAVQSRADDYQGYVLRRFEDGELLGLS